MQDSVAYDHREIVVTNDGDKLRVVREGDIGHAYAIVMFHLRRQLCLDHDDVTFAKRKDHAHVSNSRLFFDNAGNKLC